MELPLKPFAAVLCLVLAAAIVSAGGCGAQNATGVKQSSSGILSSRGRISEQENDSRDVSALSSHNAGTVSLAPAKTGCKEDTSYLNDAVFIGDSVTLKLKKYVEQMRRKDRSFFGMAKFLAAGGMGSGNALKPLSTTSIHPYYNGEKALLQDSVAKIGARKVYVMLGMNDIAVYGVDSSAENLKELLLKIIAKDPDAHIYIQSVTPMLKQKQKRLLNNASIKAYNNKLRKICRDQKWYFVDVASVMCGRDGSLKSEYCSDPNDLGIHFTDKACKIWVDYIVTHTQTGES